MDKKITGADYLYLALYAFAGIGLELILVGIIEPLFGVSLESYTTLQNIIHWAVICIIWLFAGIFLINLAKRKYALDLLEYKSKLKCWQYLGIVICLIVSIASHYIDWGGELIEEKDGMKKTLLFIILQQYADWEAAYISSAISMLGQGEYEIKTVSLSKDCIQSIGGFKVLPDYDIASVPNDYEALILIGGMTWRSENTQKIKKLVEDCAQKGKILGAICDASAFLGTVGVLNDVIHTSNNLNDLKQWAGSVYTGETKYIAKQAVSDKNIITANGTASMEFAKEILLALNVASEDKVLDWYNFHKLGFYTAPMPKI